MDHSFSVNFRGRPILMLSKEDRIFSKIPGRHNYHSNLISKQSRAREQKKFTLKLRPISEKMTMAITIIILTIFNLLPPRDAYQLTYYDCDAPTSIHTYASHQLCDTEPGERRHATKMAYLLQQRRVDHLSGFHCQVWRSTFKYKCGVWGHLKTLSPPEILHDYELTVSE